MFHGLACGNGDVSFCDPDFVMGIIDAIKKHNVRCPDKTYYLQSKKPAFLEPFLGHLPGNVIALTTLETNRDQGYREVSKAPLPSDRYQQLLELDYHRKVVTIEPVMDFDTEIFTEWILELGLEYVWLGYNSRPKQVSLPEPSGEKLIEFARGLQDKGIKIKEKDVRGLALTSDHDEPRLYADDG